MGTHQKLTKRKEKIMKTKRVGAIVLLLVLVLSLAGCGKSLKKQLVGSWYLEGRTEPAFTFYDDGSCKIQGEYGTGKWTLVNDNQLKISNFYGETVVITIDSVKGGCLTFTNEIGDTGYLWSIPHDE